jgi:hypothetical protein
MMPKKSFSKRGDMKTRLFVLLSIGILLAACAPATPVAPTPDINAIRTSAANTVVAEFTLTAASWTVTPLPPTETLTPEPPTAAPTNTPAVNLTQIAQGTPGALCDSLSFSVADVDVTIPDGMHMTPGQDFIKTWKIKNDGICTWGAGYGLIYSFGEKMSGQPVPLGVVVEIGQEVQVSVNLKAPDKIGEYLSAWQMVNAKGIPFGKALFVKIIVQ